MQCERLLNLAKSWYLSVKEETMAPARMVQFIKQHVAGCSVCREDPDIHDEIAKITEVILPESKIPKAVRMKQEMEEMEEEEQDREEEENEDEDEDIDESEEDEDFEDDDDEEDEEPLPSEEDLQ